MSESVPIPDPLWRKSSHSGESDCVEVGFSRPGVLIRDSVHHGGLVLHVSPTTWRALISCIRT